MYKSLNVFAKWNFITTLIISFTIISCKVTLIGTYDPITDEGIQRLERETFSIIVKLERNIDNGDSVANYYNNFKLMYEEIYVDLTILKIRCNRIPKYDKVLEQIGFVDDNIRLLEQYHKLKIKTKEEINPIKSGLETQFGSMIKLQQALKEDKEKQSHDGNKRK